MNKPLRICLASAAALAAACIPLAAWYSATRVPWPPLRAWLMAWTPLLLDAIILLLALAVIVNAGALWRAARAIDRRARMLALVIAAAAVLVSAFVAPRTNRLYFDEHIYQSIGQNIALARVAGMCNDGEFIADDFFIHAAEYNKQPNGYPHLLSVVYRLLGVREAWAQVMNNALAGLAVLLAFVLARWLARSDRAGLLAALVTALIPQVHLWCSTAAAEPSAMVAAAAGIAALAWYLEAPGARRLFLAVAALAYAVYFRPESLLVLVAAAVMVAAVRPGELLEPRLCAGAVALAVLIVPEIIHLAAVRNEAWGNPLGAKFTLSILRDNLAVNGLFYVTNRAFPALVTLGALAGALGVWRAELRWRKLPFIVWALLLWGVFLSFYAGSYGYGVDVRFSLVSLIPLAVLAGMGFDAAATALKARNAAVIISALLIANGIQFLPLVRRVSQEAWQARADVAAARDFAAMLPDDAVVLTHNPNMFLLWGKSAAQMSIFTEYRAQFENGIRQRYPGGVYLHWNFWCTVPDRLQHSFAVNVTNAFPCTPVADRVFRGVRYALYRLDDLPRERRDIPPPPPPGAHGTVIRMNQGQ